MQKKKVLIGLFGLTRTFKYTSKFLFEKIINPNSSEYTFDIIINTDFENSYLSANRTMTEKYKYDDIDLFYKELNDFYNIQNNLKHILIYNKCNNYIIFSWFLVYKRIQQILQKSFENNDIYDIYIMMRMDIIVDNIINLNELDKEIVFISSKLVRDAYLHNRDIDYMFYGNHIPFMLWVYSTVNLFQNILDKKDESKTFFDNKPICSDELIDYFEKIKTDIQFDDCDDIENRVMLLHTNNIIADEYILNNNNNKLYFNLNQYYNLEFNYLFKHFLYNIKMVLHSYNWCLSENKNKIHSTIIR